MLIEQQIKHFRSLSEWFQLPLGLSVGKEFSRALQPLSHFLKGDNLLQLGSCGDNIWLNKLNFNHKWVASPYPLNKKNQLQCSLNQIPLLRNSLDCVLVPLTLEPFGNSFSLLDEIERILKPMGFVVLLSINPWSLWGGAMKCGLLHCYNDHHIKMRSPLGMNRTLLQRGYRQRFLSNFCYVPPINNQFLLKKLSFLDEVGKMLWPFPSGFYCYVAQKYEMISPSVLIESLEQPLVQGFKSSLQPVIN